MTRICSSLIYFHNLFESSQFSCRSLTLLISHLTFTSEFQILPRFVWVVVRKQVEYSTKHMWLLYAFEVLRKESFDILKVVLVFFHEKGHHKDHTLTIALRGTYQYIGSYSLLVNELIGARKMLTKVSLLTTGDGKYKSLIFGRILGFRWVRLGQVKNRSDCVF